jgi:hypothetical protein
MSLLPGESPSALVEHDLGVREVVERSDRFRTYE